jgi:general secretion pathway protein D
MSFFKRLTAVVVAAALVDPAVPLTLAVAAALLGPAPPLHAKTKKGSKLFAEGQQAESKKDWDKAVDLYEQALSEYPSDLLYQLAAEKARFQASQLHVEQGLKLRAAGQLGEALLQFQKGYAFNPASAIAAQEIALTKDMIERERKRVETTGKETPAEQRGLTPSEESKRDAQERVRRMLPVPELKPVNPLPRDFRLVNQPPRVIYETIGKIAGVNVLLDPEYRQQGANQNPITIDLSDATLEQALDYVAVITKTFWKALSPNTIFVTMDNPNKRRDYAEFVAQTFYLSNIQGPQELQEIVNAVRTATEIPRVVAFNPQNAIIVRGEADQVALAEKMIRDLDKPRSEVIVDIMVIEATNVFTRQLTAAIASTGLNIPVNFTPRNGLQVVTNPNTGSNGSNGSTGSTGSSSSSSAATGTSAIPLSNLGHIASSDFSMTLPSALLQAAMSDSRTKVLQAPQLRALDNIKATLKIGEREPTATGSFGSGLGGVVGGGISPLVQTQFTYLDVGVNVELTPRVHETGDVSMHIDLDISSVTGNVNLGGLNQPIIGQRKVGLDIRLREGEVSLLGGLMKSQDTKQVTGIPGLSSIPLIRRLFSGESIDRESDNIMIAVVPHVVRRPEITVENLRGIAVGNQQTIRLNYAPRADELPGGPPRAASAAPIPPGVPASGPGVVPAPGNPPGVPPGVTPGAVPPGATPPATAPPATAPPATAPPATAPATTPDQPNAPGGVRVRFSAPQVETTTNGTFSVSLSIDGNNLAGAPMQVRFDPKVLRLDDVVRGEYFSRDGQQVVFTKNILNDAGVASVQLSRVGGAPGVSGQGTLVTLNFTAVGKGQTAVTVPYIGVQNTQGQNVPVQNPVLSVNVK